MEKQNLIYILWVFAACAIPLGLIYGAVYLAQIGILGL